MAKTNIPTPAELRNLLRYDHQTGKLYWRERTPDMFNAHPQGEDMRCAIWNARYAGAEALATNDGKGYLCGGVMGSDCLTHRVIWAMHHGAWPKQQIDHINHVRNDNRIENLREVTSLQNSKNSSKRSDNRSGHTGICWHKARSSWQAYIKVGKTRIHLGLFSDLNEAMTARRAAEARYDFHPNHGR